MIIANGIAIAETPDEDNFTRHTITTDGGLIVLTLLAFGIANSIQEPFILAGASLQDDHFFKVGMKLGWRIKFENSGKSSGARFVLEPAMGYAFTFGKIHESNI